MSNLSHETGIDISIVILLSNYASTLKELKNTLESNSFLSNYWGNQVVSELLNIIDNDFETFTILDTRKIEEKWNQRIGRKEVEQKKADEQIEKAAYTLLCDYFELPDNQRSRIRLRNEGISAPWLADEIIEYCKEKGFTTLGGDGWNGNNTGIFLEWYAKKHDKASHPDALQQIGGLVGISF